MAFCFKCGELTDNNFCKECGKEESIPLEAILEVPSPFGDKSYEMKKVDEKYGYIFFFKEGEPKMPNKEAHVHILGHGREIQYYLSPFRLKKKKPKNFPEGEESKLERHAYQNRTEYLIKWDEIKNS